MIKPIKKSDKELYELIKQKIASAEYFITNHAEQRIVERKVSIDVLLRILEGGRQYGCKRNKSKDVYENGHEDWNYCIECLIHDDKKLRSVVSFDDDLMLVITVMWLRS
jgi:hypothetical protein